MRYFIIGAGIWGLTMARLIAEKFNEPVTVVEARSQVGGNSWSYFDAETGIECHRYGSHIFHTSNAQVWEFITRFDKFTNYRHKVLANHAGRIYSMPVNLFTINALYGTSLTPEAAREFVAMEAANALGHKQPVNLEEKALFQIGAPLYEAFIRHYTAKQWGKAPAELPSSIISRLPVRYSYDISYFSDTWQGVPESGYGKLFTQMAAHPLIEVRLNCEFAQMRHEIPADAQIIYTGLPDALFAYKYGALEWRSLRFEWETLPVADFQGTSVMNYTDAEPAYTRIHEFKHYNPERREIFEAAKTVICREFPSTWRPGGDAYYPIPSIRNQKCYELYAREADKVGIILGGRLGRYKYLDMDKAIADAMNVFSEITKDCTGSNLI